VQLFDLGFLDRGTFPLFSSSGAGPINLRNLRFAFVLRLTPTTSTPQKEIERLRSTDPSFFVPNYDYLLAHCRIRIEPVAAAAGYQTIATANSHFPNMRSGISREWHAPPGIWC
jgi:hypothetical protein